MAGGGPGTRTVQFLVVRKPNSWNGGAMGDQKHDAPIGEVVEGMDTVFDRLYEGYGDLPEPRCANGKCKNDPARTPDQTKIFSDTHHAHLRADFPKITFIKGCDVLHGGE